MRGKSAIAIPDPARKIAVASIRRYFAENMEEEIGDLKSEILLDFVLAEIGPSIYNQAITDAQHFIEESAVDMASACDRAEFPYWVKPGRAR
ncbi:MAG: DUF2164 domain-containing protein [Gemmatimonadota bacterium]|nr:DUF2164 domain-containing protein [Gemmatimonadota bacterium]